MRILPGVPFSNLAITLDWFFCTFPLPFYSTLPPLYHRLLPTTPIPASRYIPNHPPARCDSLIWKDEVLCSVTQWDIYERSERPSTCGLVGYKGYHEGDCYIDLIATSYIMIIHWLHCTIDLLTTGTHSVIDKWFQCKCFDVCKWGLVTETWIWFYRYGFSIDNNIIISLMLICLYC